MLVIYAGDRTGKGRRDFQEGMLGVKAPRLRDPACAGDFEFRIGEGLLTQRTQRTRGTDGSPDQVGAGTG